MTTQSYGLPVPEPNALTQPFWDAARRHELVVQRCRPGSHLFFYPREYCPVCLSGELEWVAVSGRGRLYSHTVVNQPGDPRFQSRIPYVYAVVQLDEGPRMVSNLVDCAPEDARVDMCVAVTFDDVTPQISLPKFRPA